MTDDMINEIDFLEAMSELDINVTDGKLTMEEVYDFSESEHSANAIAGELDGMLALHEEEHKADVSITVDDGMIVLESEYETGDGVPGKLFSLYAIADNSMAIASSYDTEEAMEIVESIALKAKAALHRERQEEYGQ